MDIYIASREFKPDDLIHRLEGIPGWQPSEIRLTLRRKEQAFRTLDPTIVVAIVSAVSATASATLGALISGLLKIAEGTKTKYIVIQDKNGRRIEIPADSPKERIEEVLSLLHEMETARITIP